MDLPTLLKWHRRQARAASDPETRKWHRDAVALLDDLVQRRAEHAKNITDALAERRAQGAKLGRPRLDAEIEASIRAALQAGDKLAKIAADHGVGLATVHRLKVAMAEEA